MDAGSFLSAHPITDSRVSSLDGKKYQEDMTGALAAPWAPDSASLGPVDFPLPTHIKMDVDGIEAEILRGGKRTLSARSVRSMIIEMEGDLGSERNREVFDLMEELGFAPRPRLSPDLRNVIFERP